MDAHATVASASASLTRLPVSLASGRMRSPSAAERWKSLVTKYSRALVSWIRIRVFGSPTPSSHPFSRSQGIVTEGKRFTGSEGALGPIGRGKQVLDGLVPSLRSSVK